MTVTISQMMNHYGSSFHIVDDMSYEIGEDYKDITKDVYEKYLSEFDGAKEFYEKEWK